MSGEQIQKVEGKIQTLEQLINNFQAEPRLSGVLVFRWDGIGFSPKQAFRNPSPDQPNALTDTEWEEICRVLGFPT